MLHFPRRKPRYIILLMDEEKLKQIRIIYEQILGLLHGLNSSGIKGYIYDGTSLQYKKTVEDLAELTQQDLKHFLPDQVQGENQIVYDANEIINQANGLAAWVKATYLPERSQHYIQTFSPTTSVNVSQDVNVTQVVTLDIFEILTTKEKEFNEGSKERTFIEKLKNGLKGVQSTAAILALIAKTANDCGLLTSDLHKIFS